MVRPSLSSLRVRLVLLVLIAVVPAFALVIYTGFEQRANRRQQAEGEVVLLAQVLGGQQGQAVEGGRQFLATLAGLVAQADPDSIDPVACGRALGALLQANPRYDNLAIADENGQVFCSGLPLTLPVDASERSWFRLATETREFAVGDYQIGVITGAPTVNLAYPVLDKAGAVQAVIFSALDLQVLNDLVAQAELPDGASVTVVDRNGVILARYPEPEVWVGRPVPEVSSVAAILAGTEQTTQTSGVDGVERLSAFAPLTGGEAPAAYVKVGLSTADLFADANATLTRNLALLAAAAALALGAAWFGGGLAVLSPVKSLLRATDRLSVGDLGARSGLRHDRGELGQLAHAFDEMATSLELREEERKRAEEALAQQARELAVQAQDLARSNADLEQFAYVASHDLQEPLRMVANYTQLLGRRYKGKLDPDADEFIDYAVDGATRMQRLIDDLLAFSGVGTRGKELEPVACAAVVERALANLAAAIAETGAVITCDELPVVLGDDGQLGQLFQNLIANAIRFRGAEPPHIHVSAVRAGNEWTLSVQDNGIGVDPQYTDRVFVIFQRLHTRAEYPGTGIGLAICKKIAERHGGRIWIESDGEHGSMFRFTLRAATDVSAVEQEERTSELVAIG